MILDTSAVIAVLTGEPERDTFLASILADPVRFMSAVSVVEAGIVIEARFGPEAGRDLDILLQTAGVRVKSFDEDQAVVARQAWRTYGKGRHPAGLNFGDCCVYALAKVSGQPVLCKGNDFPKTDLEIVTAVSMPLD